MCTFIMFCIVVWVGWLVVKEFFEEDPPPPPPYRGGKVVRHEHHHYHHKQEPKGGAVNSLSFFGIITVARNFNFKTKEE